MQLQPYLFILQRLNDHGHSAYFVGGCVRDFLMNRQIKDVDIATSAPAKLCEQIFCDCDIDSSAMYFGVISLDKPVKCQIATYRSEGDYKNHRYPRDIRFVNDVTLDATRRDFTINAIYLDKDGKYFDPYSGKSDIERKIIRSIGNPQVRLDEDALRILRAVRFSVLLEFELEENLLNACIMLSDTLIYLKEDTVYLERLKLFEIKLNSKQKALLDHYRNLIPTLSKYF